MIRLFLSLSFSPTFSLLLALGRFCSLHGIKGPLVAPVLSLVVVRAMLVGVAREKERAVRVVLAPSFLLSFLRLPFHSFPLFLRTLTILLIQGSVGRVGPVAALSIPAIGASIELSLNVASSFSPTADEKRRRTAACWFCRMWQKQPVLFSGEPSPNYFPVRAISKALVKSSCSYGRIVRFPRFPRTQSSR